MSTNLLNFLQSNYQELIQIYITERKGKGDGILMITQMDNEKVNVNYLTNDIIPEQLLLDINNRRETNKNSIIYFYLSSLSDLETSQIVEIDLDNNK
jgi:hypothetical protein